MSRPVPRERDLREIYLDACFYSVRKLDPNLEKVKACLLLGADVNWTDRYEGSGLQMAARSNSLELLELLLSEPALNVNFRGDRRDDMPLLTALELTSEAGHASIVRSLCRHGEINIGSTALHLAIEKNRVGCVEALKEAADDEMDWKKPLHYGGRTPVAEAAARGFADVLEVLLSVTPESRLNLNNVDHLGRAVICNILL